MNSLIVLVFLCGGISFCCGENLRCVFVDKAYLFVGTLYTCDVTSLVNIDNNVNITGHSGVHTRNRSDRDVEAIFIHETNMKYIPRNLGLLFNHQLKALFYLTTQLVEIKAEDFVGMENLEYLSFHNNRISSLPVNVLANLTKLRLIEFALNQIEVVPRGLFDHNLDLDVIRLYNNRIRFIGSGMFSNLRKLNVVRLTGNVCLNNSYQGPAALNQLQIDMRNNCKIPNEEQMIEMEDRIKCLENDLAETRQRLIH